MPDPDGTILVSTHDLPLAGRIREAFRHEGYRVELVTPGEDVSGTDEAVLLVLTAGLGSGETDRQIEAARRDLRVPVFAVAADEAARAAAREREIDEVFGASPDVQEILVLGRRIVERLRLQEVTGIVGETDAIRQALERVAQIARVDATVLVTGESGSGKELVARGIHALSPRRHEPFIAVNVAALSDTLLESELFGHEKGAFTGAIDSRKGLFELAHTGTIFLDEIGEMPLPTQTKLLRVLEQREFLRVGGEKPIKVDVRVIAATNQDLRQLVSIGDFRRDLYFRLNVLSIELPPLRERKDDIPLLVEHFTEEATRRHDRPFKGISEEAQEILREYRWPGNVRELRNLVESMVVLAPGGVIRASDIPPEIREPHGGRSLLPARVAPRSRHADTEGDLRPELEFVFRTLVELRMDMDDLRREFEQYRERSDEGRTLALPSGGEGWEIRLPPAGERPRVHFVEEEGRAVEPTGVGAGEPTPEARRAPDDATPGRSPADERAPEAAADEGPGGPASSDEAGREPEGAGRERDDGGPGGTVVYRPGMSMEDLEREAIVAALSRVGGNRRRAAESLGIGERTLYRKIKKYELEV